MDKRAIAITTPEITTIFFAIGFLLMIFVIKNLLNMYEWAAFNGQENLADSLILQMVILFIMLFFFLIAVAFPTYQIIKNNLFIFMDRITNPDYMGWLGFNRNKRFFPQIVRIGSFGQTKGIMNEQKADIINDGNCTVILPNGNQALIVSDLLSSNIDIKNAVGWNLIKKHFGVIGFPAYELAMENDKLLFEIKEEDDTDDVAEE